MEILVYGTGAVGGYFGGRLAQAGNNVTFIARGKHLEAIKNKGLQVKSIKGDFTVYPAKATDNLYEVGEPDLILIAVKAGQVADAARALKSYVGVNTTILPLQNGISAPEHLIDAFGKHKVLGGLCKIFSQIEDYGIINHSGYEPSIVFGELDNDRSERAMAIFNLFKEAGIEALIPEDIIVEMWKKYLFICTTSSVGAISRSTFGEMRGTDETREIMKKVLTELYSVGKKMGINLPDNIVDKTLTFIDSLPDDATASMQRDIMAGRPSELEEQTGAIVRLGKKMKVPTPASSLIYSCLLPMEMRARK